jgi:hypothetical protein
MPCHELAGKTMWRRAARRTAKSLLAAVAASGLSGCGFHFGDYASPDPDSTSSKLATMLGLKSKEAKSDAATAAGPQARHIICPEVIVLEGTTASRAYAGTPPSSANLKYQYALTDTARECSAEGKDLAIKIGVAGRVLLGPAGNAGNFAVPVRMAVLGKRDNQPILSKLYHAAVTLAPGQTQADFTIISEPLRVPFIQDHTDEDYTIRVGIDEGPAAEKPEGKNTKG